MPNPIDIPGGPMFQTLFSDQNGPVVYRPGRLLSRVQQEILSLIADYLPRLPSQRY